MPNAGDIVDVTDFIVPQYIKKAASESVTSSTTVQNDDDLFADLPVGIWRVELRLAVTGAAAAAGNVRVVWTTTGTMTLLGRTCLGPGTGTTDVANGTVRSTAQSSTTEVVYGLTSTTTAGAVWEDLLWDVSVAGTLRMQWAQGTSNGTATVMGITSRMFITQVEVF